MTDWLSTFVILAVLGISSGVLEIEKFGIRCDRIYQSIHKHDDFCYLSFRPKELKEKK